MLVEQVALPLLAAGGRNPTLSAAAPWHLDLVLALAWAVQPWALEREQLALPVGVVPQARQLEKTCQVGYLLGPLYASTLMVY